MAAALLSDLDATLRQMLTSANATPPGLAPIDSTLAAASVSFELPNIAWQGLVSQLTVNCYLYNIVENRDTRTNEGIVVRSPDGTRAGRYAPPVRIDCSYCITAWSPAQIGGAVVEPAIEEHRLLSDVLLLLLRTPTLPASVLQGTLQGQMPPYPTIIASTDAMKNRPEFWNALGQQLKPSLNYVVTLALFLTDPPTDMAPLATQVVVKAGNLQPEWPPTVIWPGPTSGPFSLAWSARAGKWITSGFDPSGGGSCTVYSLDPTGNPPVDPNPVPLPAPAPAPIASIATLDDPTSPSDGEIYVCAVASNTVYQWTAPPAGAFTGYGSSGGGNSFPGASDVKVAYVGDATVMAVGSATPGQAALCSTAQTSTTPSSAAQGLTVMTWILKSNGALALAIPSQPGPPSIYACTDGSAWNPTPLSSLTSTDVPIDVAWSTAKKLWLMAVRAGGLAFQTKLLTSPDGAVWTPAGSTLTAANVVAVSAFRSLWLAAVYDPASFRSQVISSPDGVQWNGGTQASLSPNQPAPPLLVGAPGQVALFVTPLAPSAGSAASQLPYCFSMSES